MKYPEFEALVEQMWQQIPERYKEGISALQVLRGKGFDPELDDCPIFGDCGPDMALDALPDAPVMSTIRIFYGSFRLIAREEPDFDWEAELWETLLHEIRHHLEWRSNRDGLGEQEDVERELLAQQQGKPFDPSFYRYGVPLLPGVNAIGNALFIELFVASSQWRQLGERAFVVDCGGWRFFSGAELQSWGEGMQAMRIDEAEQLDDAPAFDLEAFEEVTLVLRRRALASLSLRRPRLSWR